MSLASIIAKKRSLQDQKLPDPKRFKYKTKREIEEEKRKQEEQEKTQNKEEATTETNTSQEDKPEETNVPEEQPSYPVDEIKKRLRQANLVVTYFGETDLQREKRWLKYAAESTETSAYSEGRKNEFDTIMRNIGSEKKDDHESVDPREKKNDTSDLDHFINLPIERTFDGLNLCNEDKVLLMFRKLQEEWKRDIAEHEAELKKTMKGKKQIATFDQSALYLKPLFKSLRQRNLNPDILKCLVELVEAVKDRDYAKAGNFYIQMAVGNAPWPIGVTMVGIHERSAREKISSNQVAHVLNDETQRKYIQCVKRLISFCQKKHPTAPSKQIG